MNNLFIVFSFFVLFTSCSQNLEDNIIKETKEFQYKMNIEFSDKKTSPLTEQDFISFSKLEFFEINKDFNVIANFKRTPNETPFDMLTTTSRLAKYVKFGEAQFKLNDKTYLLTIYQNQDLNNDPKYKDHLFLPFTDLTNGKESYAGGRYLDLSQKDITNENKIVINFNKAYNPYCAYNHKYSCPIPPKENNLNTIINAGVKKFH